MNESNFIILKSKYKILLDNKIGEGMSSHVYKGKDLLTNINIAVKILNKNLQIKKNGIDFIQNEININQYLMKNPDDNIIKCLDILNIDNIYYLIFEYADCALHDIMNSIHFDNIFYYIKQLCLCLIYLKKHNIIHNDIKPQNILVVNNILKLCDFGMATFENSNHGLVCGSPIYMNIEKLMGDACVNSDFWAFKIIYYNIVYKSVPFDDVKDRHDLAKKILSGIKFPHDIKPHSQILKKLFDNVITCPEEILNNCNLNRNIGLSIININNITQQSKQSIINKNNTTKPNNDPISIDDDILLNNNVPTTNNVLTFDLVKHKTNKNNYNNSCNLSYELIGSQIEFEFI